VCVHEVLGTAIQVGPGEWWAFLPSTGRPDGPFLDSYVAKPGWRELAITDLQGADHTHSDGAAPEAEQGSQG
jgi:hypothetical protein